MWIPVWLCSDLRAGCGLILVKYKPKEIRDAGAAPSSTLMPLVWHYYPLVVYRYIVFKISKRLRAWPDRPYFNSTSFCANTTKCTYRKTTRARSTWGLHWPLSHCSDVWQMEWVSVAVISFVLHSNRHKLFTQLSPERLSAYRGCFFFCYPSDAFAVMIICDLNKESDKSEQLLWREFRGVFN